MVEIREFVARPEPSNECRSILLVDDEERILNSLVRLLRERYRIERTTSPERALDLLAEEEFALLISDQRMPQMLGTDLCARAAEVAPETIRVILTGHSDVQAAIDAINRGSVFRFMLKPWKDDEVLLLARQALSQYNLAAENRRLNDLTERQNEELQGLNAKLEGFNEKLRVKVFERTRQVTELNQKLGTNFRGTVDLLARLSSMHSQVLGHHSKRVAEMAVKIGRRRGLSDELLTDLQTAAELHDIGKIGMDPAIVGNASGELTSRDKAVLRTHPVTGAALIQRIPGLEHAASMVRHHHEQFDGNGYPDKLRGDSIPVGSRIIAVADAFDNFLNLRSRFTVTEAENAIAHVESQSGTRFDPRCVDLLKKVVSESAEAIRDISEVEITLKELRTGMILSRDLLTVRGVLLLNKGAMVSEKDLPRLLKLNESDPIVEGPYIHRRYQSMPSPAS